MQEPLQNSPIPYNSDRVIRQFYPSQHTKIEQEIQQILSLSQQQSALQFCIQSLLQRKQASKGRQTDLVIFQDQILQVKGKSCQLQINFKSQDEQVRILKYKNIHLQRENQQLRHKIKQNQTANMNSAKQGSLILHNQNNIDTRIRQLNDRIALLQIKNETLASLLSKAQQKLGQASEYQMIRLIQIPTPIIAGVNETAQMQVELRTIERQVLVEVPVPIYVKSYKDIAIISQNHYTQNCLRQMQGDQFRGSEGREYLRQARVDLRYSHQQSIDYGGVLKQQNQMRIQDMCKSIRSQSVDEHSLQDCQRMKPNQTYQKANKIAHKKPVQPTHEQCSQSLIILRQIIQVPVYIIKQSTSQPQTQPRQVIVEKEVVKYVQVPIENIVYIERIVYVEQPSIVVQRLVEIPVLIQIIRQVVVWGDRLIEGMMEVRSQEKNIVQQDRYFERLIEVPVQVEVEKIKIVEVQIVKMVEIPVIQQIEVINEIRVNHEVEIIKEVLMPLQITKYVTKQVVRQVPIEIINEIMVFRDKFRQIILQVPTQVQRIVQVIRQIPIQIIKEVIKQISIQIIKRVQIIRQIPVEIPVQIHKIVELQVDKIVEVQKIVQVQVQKIVIVQRIVVAQKIVEVQIQKVTQKIIQINRVIQLPVQNAIVVQRAGNVRKDKGNIVGQSNPRNDKIVILQIPMQNIIQQKQQGQSDSQKVIVVESPLTNTVQVQRITYIDRVIQMPTIIQVVKLVEVPIQNIIQVIKLIQVHVQTIVYILKLQACQNHQQDVRLIQIPGQVENRNVQIPPQINFMAQIFEEQQQINIVKQVQRIVLIQSAVQPLKGVYNKTQEKRQHKIIQIQVPVQVIVQKITLKQVIIQLIKQKQVQVEKQVIVWKQVPVYVEKKVEKLIPFQVQKLVQVQKIVEKQVIVQVIKTVQVQRIVEKIVQVKVPQYIDRQKVVQVAIYIDRQIRVQVPIQVQKIVYIQSLQFGTTQHPSPQKLQFSRIKGTQSPDGNCAGQLSDRSNEERSMYRNTNDQQFYLAQPTQLLDKDQNTQHQSMVERLEENQRRMEEENSYLREKLLAFTQSIIEKDEQVVRLKRQGKRLKDRLQKWDRSQAQQAHDSQQKLNIEMSLSLSMQRRIHLLQYELASNTEIRDQYQKQAHQTRNKYFQLQSQYKNLEKLLSQKQKQLDLYERQMEEKNEQIQELNSMYNLINEHVSNVKSNEEQLSGLNRKLEDQNIELKARFQELNQGSLMQSQNQVLQKQASFEYDRQQFNKQKSELESLYKLQIENVLTKYLKLAQQNKKQITQLERCVQLLQQQNEQLKQKQHIPLKQPTKRPSLKQQQVFEQHNKPIKASDAINKQNQQIKQHQQNILQHQSAGSGHLKSFSFSQKDNKQDIKVDTNDRERQIKGPQAKIRIQQGKDTKRQCQDGEFITRLTQLVKAYQQEMEKKDGDITQMKKLLCSYEAAIQELQRERNHLHGHRSIDIQQSRSQRSDSKANLEANVYISTLLRKLSLSQQHQGRQRAQKLSISIRMRDLERNLQVERNSLQLHEQDDELLQQVVLELQRQKQRTQQLRNQIISYRSELQKLKYGIPNPHNSLVDFNQNSSPIRVGNIMRPFKQDLQVSNLQDRYYDQRLHQQMKIYKIQYFKVLQWNKRLKNTILRLQEQIQSLNGVECQQHMRIIDHLTLQLERFEGKIMALEQQIDFAYESSGTQQVPTSSFEGRRYQNYGKMRTSRNQQERNYVRHATNQTQEKDVSYKFNGRSNNFNKEWHDGDLIQQDRSIKRSRISSNKLEQNRFIDANLDVLIAKQIPIQVKYFLTFKLLQFGLQQIGKGILQSLCPQKICILHFNVNAPENIKITRTSVLKGKEKVKMFQAPEVLVGQNQSESSYVWTFGILIDLVFHERTYYHKFADILAKKQSYKFQSQQADQIGQIVQSMIIKDKQKRISMREAYQRIKKLMS